MRFAFSEEHEAIRSVVADLLSRRFGVAEVRAAWEAGPGVLDRGVWNDLTDLGAMHVLVSEADGGLGLDDVALVGLFEESGRAALPHPLVESAAVAAPLLGGRVGPTMVGAAWRNGPVPCGLDVDQVLVVDDDALVLFERDELDLVSVGTVDSGRRLARVEARRGVGTVLTDDPVAVALAFDRAALGTAAQLIGLADTMLAMTTAYVGERVQFGAPVGSFQAVKHHLADALMELSFARPAVHRAAHAVAHGEPDASRAVSVAKVLASDAAETVGRQALQCHGAIGYTVECDLHLWLKRSWALSRAWGSAGWHTERVAVALAL